MLHHTLGCGGGVLDYDLDGWSDVYFAAAGGTPRLNDSQSNGLFRNRDGVFSETTTMTGSGDTGFGQGIAVGDVNEDGFPDLVVLNFGRNVLYVNQGDGTFENASDRWFGSESKSSWSTSGAIMDLNGDRLADLVSLDGRLLNRTSTIAAAPDITGRGLGIVAGSLDDHDGIDVLIANDMTNNHYWSTATDTKSTYQMHELAMTRGLASDAQGSAQGSMGIAVGDMDRDGRFDLFVTNFADESNVMHRYRGHHSWVDDTNRLGLASNSFPLVAFGTQMVDLDNDGRLEIVVTNGHVQILSPSGVRADYEQPFQVYEQNSQGKYHLVSPSMQEAYVSSLHVGRALWTIDADRDGLTDLFVTHQTEPVALLMNQSAQQQSWVEFQLVGTSSSRDAIGATVELRCGDEVWKKPLTSGDGYLCVSV